MTPRRTLLFVSALLTLSSLTAAITFYSDTCTTYTSPTSPSTALFCASIVDNELLFSFTTSIPKVTLLRLWTGTSLFDLPPLAPHPDFSFINLPGIEFISAVAALPLPLDESSCGKTLLVAAETNIATESSNFSTGWNMNVSFNVGCRPTTPDQPPTAAPTNAPQQPAASLPPPPPPPATPTREPEINPTPAPELEQTPSPAWQPTASPLVAPPATPAPPAPTPEPELTSTLAPELSEPTPTPAYDPTPSPLVTPPPTDSPTPAPTPSNSPSASPLPTPSPVPTPSRSPSRSPSLSPTPTPTRSPSPTKSPTRSPTPSPTRSSSPTPTPTRSPSPSPSPSPTPVPLCFDDIGFAYGRYPVTTLEVNSTWGWILEIRYDVQSFTTPIYAGVNAITSTPSLTNKVGDFSITRSGTSLQFKYASNAPRWVMTRANLLATADVPSIIGIDPQSFPYIYTAPEEESFAEYTFTINFADVMGAYPNNLYFYIIARADWICRQ